MDLKFSVRSVAAKRSKRTLNRSLWKTSTEPFARTVGPLLPRKT
jgi:hypothetical protein